MLVTSIFSFSHKVFTLSKMKFIDFATFEMSFQTSFNLNQSKILLFCKQLNENKSYEFSIPYTTSISFFICISIAELFYIPTFFNSFLVPLKVYSLSLSHTTNFRLFQTETLQTTISKLIKMAESSSNG